MNSESSKVLTSAPKSSLLLFISLPELDGIELYNFEMQLANPGMLTAQSLGLSLSLSLSPSLSPSLSLVLKSPCCKI